MLSAVGRIGFDRPGVCWTAGEAGVLFPSGPLLSSRWRPFQVARAGGKKKPRLWWAGVSWGEGWGSLELFRKVQPVKSFRAFTDGVGQESELPNFPAQGHGPPCCAVAPSYRFRLEVETKSEADGRKEVALFPPIHNDEMGGVRFFDGAADWVVHGGVAFVELHGSDVFTLGECFPIAFPVCANEGKLGFDPAGALAEIIGPKKFGCFGGSELDWFPVVAAAFKAFLAFSFDVHGGVVFVGVLVSSTHALTCGRRWRAVSTFR